MRYDTTEVSSQQQGLLARWAGICAVSMLLVACGGGGASTGFTSSPDTEAPANVQSLQASAPGDLLNYVKDKIKQGSEQNSYYLGSGNLNGPVPAPAAGSPSADRSVAFSGTRLQEQGVDEADLVKTDGTLLLSLTKSHQNGSVTVPTRLQAHQRQSDGQLASAGSLEFGFSESLGMYLASSAKRIALLEQKSSYFMGATPAISSLTPIALNEQIGLDVVSLDVPGTLTTAKRVRIDGNLVGTRMIGNTLYVVATWTPRLQAYALPATATTAERDAKLAQLSNQDVLPTIQIDDQAAVPLLADTDCYLQAANAALQVQITSITAFDLASASLQRKSRCIVGGSEGLYMSSDNVYLTTSRFYSFDAGADLSTRVYKSETTTDIHKFSLQALAIDYKGSGTVPGHLGWDKAKLAYRMSEYQGDLRVLSFTGQSGWGFPVPLPAILPTANSGGTGTITVTTSSGTAVIATPSALTATTASPATLTILREVSGKGLQVVGSLPNSKRPAAIGKPDEQVYAVQFVGSRAYVVTFRQVDPLYVLDLSNPTDPQTLGELMMPGFSDYLVPLGDNLLFGAGKDASDTGLLGGVKVALMDVSNPANPRILNSMVFGKRGSSSTLDQTSHGINILQQGSVFRIAMPVRVHETAPVPNITVQTFYNPTYQALQRFEVDTTAKTMVSKPQIKSADFSPTDNYSKIYGLNNVANDRSVQIDSMVYYFSGGRFISASW
jgi:Beta propeller domain